MALDPLRNPVRRMTTPNEPPVVTVPPDGSGHPRTLEHVLEALVNLPAATAPVVDVVHAVLDLAVLVVADAGCALTFFPSPDVPAATAQPVDASDPAVLPLARAELELREGPASQAAALGEVVWAPDLGHEPRWPAWARRATSRGVLSALAVPLVVDASVVVAAATFVSDRRDAFTATERDAVRRFATAAASTLHTAVVAGDLRHRNDNLSAALHSRAVIDQAAGVIVARSGATPDEALARLRSMSQREHVRMAELARRTVEQAVRRGRRLRSADRQVG